ncbi:glycerol dehydrogenase Gcy1 [Talaromyces proteolyticus]|uniref:D-xylose reductase [NAD(P)H] n=1 Tax=Talaromyces proteolyticus TaxID=1131652 RepID=A0AAD4KHL7_9EURO|nr:glycerol dehydrogenase Gcy1 [Talaromyces proteolyticus]KAH8688658.1 glycerol dehydrogenase Gcy1 [Talaromyces proteolyticus]
MSVPIKREGEGTKTVFTLNTGAKMPGVGLGTWQTNYNQTREAVKVALQSGYRHIDTAYEYGNETEVGDGIKASGVPREEIWVTTKLDNPWHKRVEEGLAASLKNLQLDYVDLFLVHWPSSTNPEDSRKHYDDWDFTDTWAEMQKLLESGKVRNIGVSNFVISNMEKLLNDPRTKVVPAVNQIELHPNMPSHKTIEYMKSKNIHCTGYCCLGSTDSPLAKDKTLLKIAEEVGRTPQQVLLQWALARGTSVIPKSVTSSRIKANFELDNWSLTTKQIKALSSIPNRYKVCGQSWLPVKVFFNEEGDAPDNVPSH